MTTYTYDPTGKSVNNKVINEVHTTTQVNNSINYIIIPTYAPFFREGFKLVKINLDNTETLMREGIDYSLALKFNAATLTLGQPVYGAISLSANLSDDTFKIKTYQTLGGNYVDNTNDVLHNVVTRIYNPRITYWDQVTNKAIMFNPVPHPLDLEDATGYKDLIDAVLSIFEQVLAQINNPTVNFIQHVTRTGNVHGLTKQDLGLDKVSNLPIASISEVRDKIAVNKYVTLSQVISMLQDLSNFNISLRVEGDVVGSGTSPLTLTLKNVVTPGDFIKARCDAQGRIVQILGGLEKNDIPSLDYVSLDGTKAMLGPLNMNNQAIKNQSVDLIQTSGNKNTVGLSSMGKTYVTNDSNLVTWTILNNVPEGWGFELYQGSTGSTRFAVQTGGLLLPLNGSYTTMKRGSRVTVRCLSNSNGTSPVIALNGDIT